MTDFRICVEGVLGVHTLHRLGCAAGRTEVQTSVRVEATPADLERLLQECSEHHLVLDSVTRLDTPS